MDLLIALSLALLTAPSEAAPMRWAEHGIASVFHTGHDGRHSGGPLACLPPSAQREIGALPFCAHRFYRCGTVLIVEMVKTGRRTACVVSDHGPWGAMHEGRWVLKRRKSDPGQWRGVLDLSPGAAEALGASGWDVVRLAPLR